jgi:hypothetical protein
MVAGNMKITQNGYWELSIPFKEVPA